MLVISPAKTYPRKDFESDEIFDFVMLFAKKEFLCKLK